MDNAITLSSDDIAKFRALLSACVRHAGGALDVARAAVVIDEVMGDLLAKSRIPPQVVPPPDEQPAAEPPAAE